MFFYVLFFMACSHQPVFKEKAVKCVALVIGNQDYMDILENPINA